MLKELHFANIMLDWVIKRTREGWRCHGDSYLDQVAASAKKSGCTALIGIVQECRRESRASRRSFERGQIEKERQKVAALEGLLREIKDYQRCGAKTRTGTPCQCRPVEGKRRCKFHGGLSTGARSTEGRERLREAGRRGAQARLARHGVASVNSVKAQ